MLVFINPKFTELKEILKNKFSNKINFINPEDYEKHTHSRIIQVNRPLNTHAGNNWSDPKRIALHVTCPDVPCKEA